MTVKELYERLGADYNDAMERVFDEDLLKMLCGMFLEDKSYETLSQALSGKDYPAAFESAHTLKGVAANLGFSRLYNVASDLTESLRGGTPNGDVDGLYEKVKDEYELTVVAVKELG